MESGNTQYLFKETRLNLEPSTSTFVVNIRVPLPSSHARGAFRRNTNTYERDVDEETVFALKNLSSSSSIYQRKWSSSPSRFLWRALEDGMVLSVRAVDVCKQQSSPDASLVLNFNFSVPIQPFCIALTDPQNQDALLIYVVDQSNHLYTFTLRPDVFFRQSSLDSSISDVCRVYYPASLASRHTHRLVAVNADTLLVTLHDGGLVRLERNYGADCMFCTLSSSCSVCFCVGCEC